MPYPAVADIVATRGDELAGKVVVDITNPLDFETFDSLVVPADGSAAAELAAALPQSHVLKAFNTTFAATLASGTVGGRSPPPSSSPVTTPTPRRCWSTPSPPAACAPSTPARCSRARELEALGFLQLTLAAGEKISWTGGFGLVG